MCVPMDLQAPFSGPHDAGGGPPKAATLSDDDALSSLSRGQAVHADVQEALAR